MFPNLIIAADLQQAEYVANWLTKYPSGPKYDGIGSAPAVPRLSIDSLAWTPFGSALHHIEGLRPERIIIVDYLRWVSPIPGEFARVAQAIQILRAANGTEVVWW